MNGWAEGIRRALEYIEAHLGETMRICDIAAQAYVSEFHFQRIFSVLTGVTVGEYIRQRRLTQAAEELSAGNVRVIDVAIKYGYDSPESFARAFTRFHGVNPSAAREKGAKLRAVAPLRISLTLEGGTMMEYSVVDKAQFTVTGVARRFSPDTSYEMIPEFWAEHIGKTMGLMGRYGVCMDGDGSEFEYIIADDYDPCGDVPEGWVTRVIPAGTWAVFPVRGALPKALQDVNTRIWKEWLPNCTGYRLAGNYNIEMYAPPAEAPEDNYCEIWVPVTSL